MLGRPGPGRVCNGRQGGKRKSKILRKFISVLVTFLATRTQYLTPITKRKRDFFGHVSVASWLPPRQDGTAQGPAEQRGSREGRGGPGAEM